MNKYVKLSRYVVKETLSTEDVIPKEFLTRKEDEAYERGYAEAKSEVAREIFEDIETMIFPSIIPSDCAIISTAKLDELKKKYAEGKQ